MPSLSLIKLPVLFCLLIIDFVAIDLSVFPSALVAAEQGVFPTPGLLAGERNPFQKGKPIFFVGGLRHAKALSGWREWLKILICRTLDVPNHLLPGRAINSQRSIRGP